MQVIVMGAGAVGCYFGGLLAKAGHDVTFIGRPQHVEAINANGLMLETKAGTERIKARAAIDVSGVRDPGLVLVCVKSADTEAAGRELGGRLGADSVLVSLQNGVDNAERLAAVIGRPVMPAVVYVGTEMAGPGHVRHHGRGELVIGTSARSEAIAKMLVEAKIPTTVSATIATALWGKLIVNSAYNALSAIGGIPYGPMVQVAGARELIKGVIAECVAVAGRAGVALPSDIEEKTLAVAASMPGQMSSTAQDLARGKPTEVDFLNGYIVRKGAELGIATPYNRTLQVAVKVAERGRGIG
ncbi:MAG: 2-dehydropantoate 2-reductase [Hyphomicrobiales bacterium]|nr:2-dehydropantoate 2-reductase [Hyphomicrobiales bacterium]